MTINPPMKIRVRLIYSVFLIMLKTLSISSPKKKPRKIKNGTLIMEAKVSISKKLPVLIFKEPAVRYTGALIPDKNRARKIVLLPYLLKNLRALSFLFFVKRKLRRWWFSIRSPHLLPIKKRKISPTSTPKRAMNIVDEKRVYFRKARYPAKIRVTSSGIGSPRPARRRMRKIPT